MNILDALPAAVRHTVFATASLLSLALLNWLSTSVTTWNLPAPIIGVASILLPIIIAYVTPLTGQYGVGSAPTDSAMSAGA